MLYIDLYRYL